MSQNAEMLEKIIKQALKAGISKRNIYATNEEAREQLQEYENTIEENDIGEKSFFILVARDAGTDHEEVMYEDLRADTKEALKQMGFKKEHIDDRVALYSREDDIIIPFISKQLFDFTMGNALHLMSYFPQTPTKDDILRCHRYAWRVMEKTIEAFTQYYDRLGEIL